MRRGTADATEAIRKHAPAAGKCRALQTSSARGKRSRAARVRGRGVQRNGPKAPNPPCGGRALCSNGCGGTPGPLCASDCLAEKVGYLSLRRTEARVKIASWKRNCSERRDPLRTPGSVGSGFWSTRTARALISSGPFETFHWADLMLSVLREAADLPVPRDR